MASFNPRTLYPREKEHQMYIEQQAECAPDLVWTVGKRKQHLDPAGN
jgi:hypothetical protein